MLQTEAFNQGKDKLKVSEIFSSLQGEGRCIGQPAIFLRLAICHLHCWYCDTKYTWLFNNKQLELVKDNIRTLRVEAPEDLRVYDMNSEILNMGLDEVEERISKFECSHLVITGGEPMLQQRELVPLLRSLKRKSYFVEVETSGTIIPRKDVVNLVSQWNVSPKLSNSGNSRESREIKESINAFRYLDNAYFKFVVENDSDLNEVESIVQKFSIDPRKVFLMSEGTEEKVLRDRDEWLLKACAARGYQFTPRLQIYMWGNKRGT